MSNNVDTINSAFLLLELLILKDKQQHLTTTDIVTLIINVCVVLLF